MNAFSVASRKASLPVPMRVVEVAESTNDLARDVAKQGAPHGTPIVALQQTAGRGRLGREWDGFDGNLFLSLVLRPQLQPSEVPWVTLATAVALAEVVGERAQIKWPNDLLVDGRKLAGVLCEAELRPGGVDFAIVGVGLNVQSAPSYGVSLSEMGDTRPLPELAAQVVDAILRWTGRIRHDLDAVREAWTASCGTLGSRVTVAGVEGVVKGIDPRGALVLDTPQGEQAVLAGDVRMIDAR